MVFPHMSEVSEVSYKNWISSYKLSDDHLEYCLRLAVRDYCLPNHYKIVNDVQLNVRTPTAGENLPHEGSPLLPNAPPDECRTTGTARGRYCSNKR